MARIRAVFRRRGGRILAVAALILVVFVGAMAGAQHAADSLTVTAWQQSQDCGDAATCAWPSPKVLVFTKAFRDADTIRAVQDTVNGVPRQGPFYTAFTNGLCSALPGAEVFYYDFRFQWHGVTTQEATVASWCSEWHIATLGLPDPLTRFDPFLDNLRAIATWTGMPTPNSYQFGLDCRTSCAPRPAGPRPIPHPAPGRTTTTPSQWVLPNSV